MIMEMQSSRFQALSWVTCDTRHNAQQKRLYDSFQPSSIQDADVVLGRSWDTRSRSIAVKEPRLQPVMRDDCWMSEFFDLTGLSSIPKFEAARCKASHGKNPHGEQGKKALSRSPCGFFPWLRREHIGTLTRISHKVS